MGFIVLRPYLRQDLRETDANRYRDTQFRLYRILHLLCDQSVGAVKRPPQAGKIYECLIYRIFLDVWREAPEYLEHPDGKEAVGLVIRRDDYGVRADLLHIIEAHTPRYPFRLRLVAGRRDDPPLLAGYYRPSPEFRMHSLLAGRKKGIGIQMEDRLRPGTDG